MASSTQPTSRAAFKIDISTSSLKPVYPELWERVAAFKKEQMTKADSLPHDKIDARKAQINALTNELEGDIDAMILSGYDFVDIAKEIIGKMSEFKTSCQELETHNATYAQDAQKVHTKNLSLSDTLRKMQPDLAPFKQQPRTVTPKAAVKEPSAAHSNLRKAYDQISKIANEWHEKANYLPEEERAPYREQVNKYVGDLNGLVYEDDNPRFSEQIIRHNAQVHDDSLERNFKHNSNYEWHNPEADPLF